MPKRSLNEHYTRGSLLGQIPRAHASLLVANTLQNPSVGEVQLYFKDRLHHCG